MKKLLYIIPFIFSYIFSFSQDTVFTSEQVFRIYEYIDSLETESQILIKKLQLTERLVEQYKLSNDELSGVIMYNERYQAVREAQYSLMESNLKSYQDYIKSNKRAFWDKPLVWFIVGAGTIYFSSTIVANIR
jgi:predicted ribosome quality control (RQC) complex YloA/Tae2 family protein